jgi:hypothetical protein
MPQYCEPDLPFQIDHIIARKHAGPTNADNLALACFHCNNHKGPNLAGIDPDGDPKETVRLVRPRQDIWNEHFQWNGSVLMGRTPIGRATIFCLGINLPHRTTLRSVLIEEGVFPPN